MNENTTKVEGISFTAKDEGAAAAADKVGHAFERVHHAAEGAKEKVGEWARHAAMGTMASLGLGFGLHAVYDKAKEANLAMDRVQKSLTGTLYAMQGWKKGTSEIDKMTHSMHQAEEQTEALEEMELKLRTPIEELGATYNAVATTGFAKLGMSQKEVLELTEKITAAAKVYGTTGAEAMMKVNRVLLMGKVSQRDISGLGEKLRESLHLKAKEKLGPEELMNRMSKGLGDMVPVAQKMGQNFTGNLFEAGALVEKMLEDLSRPMFKEQTQSLSEWVTKLRTIREDGKSIMEIYGEKIAGAFRTMKDVTKFISDHWKIIAGIFVTSKLANMVSGFAGKAGAAGAASAAGVAGAMNINASVVNVNSTGVGQALGAGVGSVLKPSLASTTSKLASMASKVALVTEGLAMYYGALQVAWKLGEQLGDWAGDRGRGKDNAAALLTSARAFESSVAKIATAGYTQRDLEKRAKETGLPMAKVQAAAMKVAQEQKASAVGSMKTALENLGVKQGQKVSATEIGSMLSGLGPEMAAQTVNRLNALMPDMIHKTTAGGIAQTPAESAREIANAMNAYAERLFSGGAAEEGPNVKRKVAKNPQINIGHMSITQEFKEADPDRVFHRLMNDVQESVTAPGRGAVGANLAGGMT